MIKVHRIYEPETGESLYRVFVDKLWPRGISKEKATWDEWMKDIAPSDDLRKWFNHDPEKWEEFKQRYFHELGMKPDYVERLKQLEKKYGTLTFLYAAKDEKHNNAVALKEYLKTVK